MFTVDLTKASPGAMRLPSAPKDPLTWTEGGLVCRFADYGPGQAKTLTIEVPTLATAWHEVVRDEHQARDYARRYAPVLAKGATPQVGIFRRLAAVDMAKAVRLRAPNAMSGKTSAPAAMVVPWFVVDLAKAKTFEYRDTEPPAGHGWEPAPGSKKGKWRRRWTAEAAPVPGDHLPKGGRRAPQPEPRPRAEPPKSAPRRDARKIKASRNVREQIAQREHDEAPTSVHTRHLPMLQHLHDDHAEQEAFAWDRQRRATHPTERARWGAAAFANGRVRQQAARAIRKIHAGHGDVRDAVAGAFRESGEVNDMHNVRGNMDARPHRRVANALERIGRPVLAAARRRGLVKADARFVIDLAKARKKPAAKATPVDVPAPRIDRRQSALDARAAYFAADSAAARAPRGPERNRANARARALMHLWQHHTHHGHADAWGTDPESVAHGKAGDAHHKAHQAFMAVAEGKTGATMDHAREIAGLAYQAGHGLEEPPAGLEHAMQQRTAAAPAKPAAAKKPRAPRKPKAPGVVTHNTPSQAIGADGMPRGKVKGAPKLAKAVFVLDLAKAKKQPLGSLSHRKAGTFIKVAEAGKPSDWVKAHQVDGRWEAIPEGAKKRGGKKKAAPAPSLPPERDDTLLWYKDSPGVKAGAVHKHGSKWIVVISAKPARSRRLTAHDEDMGWGQDGGRLTEQRVRIRDATPEEITGEEKRRADKQAAAAAASPRGQFDAWREAHPEASPAPEHMTPPGVKWTEVHREGGHTFLTGEGPDGASWAQLASSGYDDHRVSYLRTPADPEKLAAVTKQHDHARGILDRIAETGTYTDADVPHLTDELHQEMFNNRWELEGPNRLRLDEHGNPVTTKDDHRATVMRRVRDAHRALGPMAGTRDLAFEHAHKDALHTLGVSAYGPHLEDALDKVRGATVPPAYGKLVADRIAHGEAALAQARAKDADEERERQAAKQRDAARAARPAAARGPSASFTKLRDGSWGVRVDGDADEGDTVTVRRRDGSKESKRLGRLVHDGGDYRLFRLTKAAVFVLDLRAA